MDPYNNAEYFCQDFFIANIFPSKNEQSTIHSKIRFS